MVQTGPSICRSLRPSHRARHFGESRRVAMMSAGNESTVPVDLLRVFLRGVTRVVGQVDGHYQIRRQLAAQFFLALVLIVIYAAFLVAMMIKSRLV